jgi:hypothetical protein
MTEPLDIQRERRWYHRQLQIDGSTEFGATFTHQDTGEVQSFAHWAPTAYEAQQQLELDLPGYSKNHEIRRQLADALDQRAIAVARRKQWGVKYLDNCIKRLRMARWSGAVGFSLAKGKTIIYWDEKAGLSRLCPDDAREESMRLTRKLVDPLEALQADGHSLHYCVFTTPNVGPGKLRKEMVSICKRFRRLLKDLPEVKGALCVLEAPLSSRRDWNVHLNVVLAVKGFCDYEKIRRQWHWNVEMRKLPIGPGVVRGALAEVIKYAVAATVAKSADKACRAEGDGHDARASTPDHPSGRGEGASSPPVSIAPPMLEWTGEELFEWLMAMRAFRRTRTYGCLFRLKKPKAEDLGQIIWLGSTWYEGNRYRVASALLDSIPEDKSTGLTRAERWQTLMRELKPAGIDQVVGLIDSIPRDVVHRTAESADIL